MSEEPKTTFFLVIELQSTVNVHRLKILDDLKVTVDQSAVASTTVIYIIFHIDALLTFCVTILDATAPVIINR